ncbi:substrate-binding domain-containing protein [Conservatibacter flavescens]|uniref:ATPase n=1 Tax=Conservatibacter flavescens TaxID=28161 RepID=A0A2M8S4R7_9PAST|nr:substrate-binding domain-containing protein [Conservatibacter flavescens]PJG86132.1 ATPase [Conservatibacter flavescens]
MKKFTHIAILASCLYSATLFAKDIVVGAPMPVFADKWLTYLYDAIKDYDEKHDDITFKLTDANNDPAKMLNDVETFIDQKVDVLLVVPTDPKIVKVIGIKAQKAGIPLIVANRAPAEQDLKYITSFVGSQDSTAGQMQAEFIVEQLQGKPANAAILLGELGHNSQIRRTEGNLSVFKDHNNINIVTQQSANYDRARGLDVATNILSAYKNINVVVSNNDEMAIGTILAAEKLGLKDEDLLIVGVDATPDALKYLGKGLDATVYQSAIGQGHTAAEVAHKVAKGETVDKITWVPFELVTPDKKAEYEAKYQ